VKEYGKIVWKQYFQWHYGARDSFGKRKKCKWVWCEGWAVEGMPGICNTYAGAVAKNMGLWEEYCEYWRNK
jgi:hypothetical protein